MSNAQAIDVLIPIYNAADTLDEALASIAAQSYADFRVIAIDDGSTDGSGEILARWGRADPRFTIITQANAGIVAALNTALAQATAPLVARMDSDDLCYPDRFQIQADYLNAHPDCVALAGRVAHIDEHGEPLNGLPHPGDPMLADCDWVPAREPYLIHPFLMARRAAMVSTGGYRFVPHSEDSDLFWRLAEVGRLHNLDTVLGQYRFHTQSISGGSILNGRIMAIGSQLGAFSARARARDEDGGEFYDNLVPALKEAGSLAAMCDHLANRIAPPELPRFRLAVGIKLLELSAYRPYEIAAEDCRFIADQVGSISGMDLPQGNSGEIRWYLGEAAARVLRQGRLRDAARLAPPSLWPTALAKAARR